MTLKDQDKEIVEDSTENIFFNLEEILKRLNKRFSFKIYTVVFDKKDKLQYCLRTRKKLYEPTVSQEKLKNIESIFKELNLGTDFAVVFNNDNTFWQKSIKKFLDLRKNTNKESIIQAGSNLAKEYKELKTTIEEMGTTIEDVSTNEDQILYSRTMNFESSKYKTTYIIEIRNVDHGTINTFYHNPRFSFLRMILDYFFLEKARQDEGKAQHFEDAVNFLRRMERAFLGKIQDILEEGLDSDLKEISLARLATFDKVMSDKDMRDKVRNAFNNQPNDLYYNFSLLEDIEDISNSTQEGANPFGSILFVRKDMINDNKIKFAIRFKDEKDKIKLSDSQRIRKLLEISNGEKELYLISNGHEILGLGEVYWDDLLENDYLIRLDFKGLSKYNFVYVYTKLINYTNGRSVLEDNQKKYISERNLAIVEDNLISISFKNPKVKEEEYSSEKFKRIFLAEFLNEEKGKDKEKEKEKEKEKLYNQLEKIEKVVRKAKEQKHGTMVVITEKKIAITELRELGAQSTLIEPREVEADYVKYLTAIDGAIYYDTEGKCHAIGVILDGIAKENIGNPRRGARYNSAQKYKEKLRDRGEKCVIVIISEDGMVDIIPDLENEDEIQNIVQEIIALINEESSKEHEDDKKKIEASRKEWEEKLKNYKDNIEHYLYFDIAEEFYDKEKYEEASRYYKLGFEQAGINSVIISDHYNRLGNCCYYLEQYEESIQQYEVSVRLSNNINSTITYYGNIGNTYFGWAGLVKKENKENKEKILQVEEMKGLYKKAIDYYTKAIELYRKNDKKENPTYHNQLGLAITCIGYLEENREQKVHYFREAIEEYTKAISIKEDDYAYYWNRGRRYQDLLEYNLALENFIMAVILNNKHTESIKEIKRILEKNVELAEAEFVNYQKKCKEYDVDEIKELEDIFKEYICQNSVEDASTEEATE